MFIRQTSYLKKLVITTEERSITWVVLRRACEIQIALDGKVLLHTVLRYSISYGMLCGGYPSVSARIFADNTGSSFELPVLVSPNGPIEVLLQYQLLHQSKSNSWHVKLHLAVRLLLIYAEANPCDQETSR